MAEDTAKVTAGSQTLLQRGQDGQPIIKKNGSTYEPTDQELQAELKNFEDF